jgi:hypothetical protein
VNAAVLSPETIDRNISSDIVGNERTIMRNLLRSAPPSLRWRIANDTKSNLYVSYYSSKTKQVYVNRSDIRNQLVAYKSLGEGLYADPSGHTVIAPPLDVRPNLRASSGMRQAQNNVSVGVDHGSGPYRRVYSLPNDWIDQGSFEMWSALHIPCNAAHYARTTGEAGYAYLGGWGSNGVAIDAGVFNTKLTNGQDQYQMFVRSDGTWLGPGIPGVDKAVLASWPCGFNMSMNFYTSEPVTDANGNINSNGSLWLSTSPYPMPALNPGDAAPIYLVIWDEPSRGGWDPECSGCILKRMTTIAQNTYEDLNENTSFEGVSWSNTQITTGTDDTTFSQQYAWGCMEWPQWEATGINPGLGDCKSSPQSAAVQVQWSSFATETDSIYLGRSTTSGDPAVDPADGTAPGGSTIGGGGGGNRIITP